MHKLNKTFLKHNKVKGFSLVEILMALGLLGIVGTMAGGLHIDALRIFNFQNAIVDRQQLYTSLAHTIGHTASCQGNLAPKTGGFPISGDVIGLYNDGTGADPTTDLKGKVKELYTFNKTGATLTKKGSPLIKIGNFGEILEVVKIALKNPDTTKNEGGVKQLKVYYKYRRGFFKTKSGGTCTNADQTGCYVMACTISDYTHTGSTTKTVDKCQASCTAVIVKGTGGGGSADCYLVDETGKTFVGCKDGTKTPAGQGTAGQLNAFFGYNAGKNNTGSQNTFIGHEVGSNNKGGGHNTFIGYKAGSSNTTGSTNTFIGRGAGVLNVDTGGNTYIGHKTGEISKGSGNTFIGRFAGRGDSRGGHKICSNCTGSDNVFIGVLSGANNKTGHSNTFIGKTAGHGNTTGTKNLFIGFEAGKARWTSTSSTSKPVTGNENIAIGYQAGEGITTGTKNLFIGYQAGRSDLDSTTKTYVTSSENTAIGYKAGTKLTSGEHNTFIGYQAGKDNNTGSYNNFVGQNAGAKNTDGTRNAFFGDNAGANQVSCNNTQAGSGGVKYCQNTFFGHYTGHNMNGGFRNVFFGAASGHDATTANNNTFMGANSGKCTTGSGNTFFGAGSGHGPQEGCLTTPVNTTSPPQITTGSDNIFIGKEVGLKGIGGISPTGDRQLNIGNLLFGKIPSSPPTTNFFNDTATGNQYLEGSTSGLVVNGDLYISGGLFGCSSPTVCTRILTAPVNQPPSSRVFKNTITLFKNYQYALSVINNTPLFTYYYNKDHPKHKRMGIISEDLPKHLQIKDKGKPIQPDWVSIYGTLWAGIKALFNRFISFKKEVTQKFASILNDLKKLIHNTKELKKEIESLKKENIRIREQITSLNKKIEAK